MTTADFVEFVVTRRRRVRTGLISSPWAEDADRRPQRHGRAARSTGRAAPTSKSSAWPSVVSRGRRVDQQLSVDDDVRGSTPCQYNHWACTSSPRSHCRTVDSGRFSVAAMVRTPAPRTFAFRGFPMTSGAGGTSHSQRRRQRICVRRQPVHRATPRGDLQPGRARAANDAWSAVTERPQPGWPFRPGRSPASRSCSACSEAPAPPSPRGDSDHPLSPAYPHRVAASGQCVVHRSGSRAVPAP